LHYKITVKGRVQGVFFRASAKEKAEELGLAGFVKNEPDGNVYIEVQGTRVEDLIAWIKGGGPQLARVDEVIIEEGQVQPFNRFKIR
jgi:acylphosphatase